LQLTELGVFTDTTINNRVHCDAARSADAMVLYGASLTRPFVAPVGFGRECPALRARIWTLRTASAKGKR